jgi:hypothetical protein
MWAKIWHADFAAGIHTLASMIDDSRTACVPFRVARASRSTTTSGT